MGVEVEQRVRVEVRKQVLDGVSFEDRRVLFTILRAGQSTLLYDQVQAIKARRNARCDFQDAILM